ncbi:MAG: phasin family protein [Gammaproteobacteria bacterium]
MQQEMFNLFNTFFEVSRQVAELNARTYEKLVNRQAPLAGLWVESSIKQFGLLTEAKDVTGYLNAQKEFVQNYADRVVDATQETAEIVAEARDELNAMMERNVADVAEKVKQAQDAAVDKLSQAQEPLKSKKQSQASAKKAA